MVYSFLSSFIMIYLTNIVGLNAGIVGTLIAVSKLFDGVTDIFFGAMIDKTKSRLGKARPWMLYAYIGCAVTLIANFAIPTNMGKFAQYAWFFIAYTLLNAVFFTANNIAYILTPEMYNCITQKQEFFISFKITGTITFNFFNPVIWIFTFFKTEF